MPSSPTYVMIPGAWHGGWVWRPVAQRLRAAGHRVLTLTMPGLSDGDDPVGLNLQHAIDHVVNEARRCGGPVNLVAHSWGGIPATAAAHILKEQVNKVVYQSAFIPTPGIALNDENPPEVAAFMRAAVAASPQRTVALPFDTFAAVLMQDQIEPVQRIVHNLLTAMPGRYMLDAPQMPPISDLVMPTAYILAEDDRGLPLPGSHLAARLGVEPIMVPGSHESLLTHPDEVAKAVLAV